MEKNNFDQPASPEREPIKLSFEFGIEQEQDRVSNTIKKAEWFKENHYKVKLPNNLTLDEAVSLDTESIDSLVNQEFDSTIYRRAEGEILGEWKEKGEQLVSGLATLGLQADPEYYVVLTRYGVGGSYNNNSRPKGIILNITMKKNSGSIICHEITHLCIEDWIKKYHVSHWAKEHLVDLIMKSIFSEEYMQDINPGLAIRIDAIFKQHQNNIEETIRKVAAIESSD